MNADGAGDRRDPDAVATARSLFLGTDAGDEAYARAMDRARDAALDAVGGADRPYDGAPYEELAAALDGDPLPEEGAGLDAALDWAHEAVLRRSVRPSHPRCIAHLQCPPAVPGLAAEAMLSAANQSLDSWDQSPAATVVEENLIDALCRLFGYGGGADGVITGGGTESNLLGLLLARNHRVREAFDRDARIEGLPPEASDLRILCSEAGHFTAAQAAAQLGLGEDAVVEVPTDGARRMDPAALDDALDRLAAADERPFALVGTAGTTDFGSVDPLDALAERAADRGLWFHVDAAYGGALAVSDAHRGKISGIERADSIAVDFHKLLYQPIGCGAFLLRDGDRYDLIARNAAYLNPESDEAAGVPNLVAKSTRTTRRFDALKPAVTFRALGREGMAALVDRTLDLADDAAELIDSDPAFELAVDPTLNAVVFRYVPLREHPDLDDDAWADRLNRALRDRLLDRGRAVVARTRVDGAVHLKFTLLNPLTGLDDVAAVLLNCKQYAADLEATALTEPGEAARGDREVS